MKTVAHRVRQLCCLAILFSFWGSGRVHAAFSPATPTDSAIEPPTFSQVGGFYKDAFDLVLSTPQPGAAIYYTRDGREPTAGDLRYTGPIPITDRTGDPNVLSLIRTTVPPYPWTEPRGPLFKATVIRARVILDSGGLSPVATHTYFVDPAGADRYSLPVIALATDAAHFFDPELGIYVPGLDPELPNFNQVGRAWERPVYVEFFEDDGRRVLAQGAGVRIHGGATRYLQVKSLRFYAREEYGAGAFNYPLFPDHPLTHYQTFILRNAGNDWGFAHFRDGLIHRLVEHLPLQVQAFRPVIVFLNGEYWGLLNLRERQDPEYLESYFGIPPDAVDMLELPGVISEGSDATYRALLAYVATQGAAAPKNYAYIQTQMDVQNFIDYNITEIYSSNTDWPHNNVEIWRYQADIFGEQPGYGFDGRWRWFIKDLDYAFVGRDRTGTAELDMLHWATDDDGNDNGAWSTLLLRGLMENEGFRHRFVNRFADLLNTAFLTERVLATIDEIAGTLALELPEHIRRHGAPPSMAAWHAEVEILRDFARARPEFLIEHIEDFFGLDGTADVELDVAAPGTGRIRINSLVIDEQTVGITGAPYPWRGIYFENVPVTITAIPNPGYRFAGWEGLEDARFAASASLVVFLEDRLTLTAHFEPTSHLKAANLPGME